MSRDPNLSGASGDDDWLDQLAGNEELNSESSASFVANEKSDSSKPAKSDLNATLQELDATFAQQPVPSTGRDAKDSVGDPAKGDTSSANQSKSTPKCSDKTVTGSTLRDQTTVDQTIAHNLQEPKHSIQDQTLVDSSHGDDRRPRQSNLDQTIAEQNSPKEPVASKSREESGDDLDDLSFLTEMSIVPSDDPADNSDEESSTDSEVDADLSQLTDLTFAVGKTLQTKTDAGNDARKSGDLPDLSRRAPVNALP